MRKLRLILAILAAKLTVFICRITNRSGTSLPGAIALKIYPDVLKNISDQFNIIVVTGTNGKTTTTGIISKILEAANVKYIFNKSGANLLSGITGTFLSAVNILGVARYPCILLEIDEAVLAKIPHHFEPNVIVVTNFFRDQLDRYGEIYKVLEGVRNAIEALPEANLVLNADDSLCASLGQNVKNKVIYYGINSLTSYSNSDDSSCSSNDSTVNSDAQFCIYCNNKYDYDYNTYGHLGGFKCSSCGYQRPSTKVACDCIYKMTDTYSDINVNIVSNEHNNSYRLKLNLPGLFNIYNILGAAAAGITLNISPKVFIPALSKYSSGFGRMEEITINGSTLKIILVKNPAGFNQTLNYLSLEKDKVVLAFILNNKAGDGVDTSWLWDVDMEKLEYMKDKIVKILVSGSRGYDMGVRLKYTNLPNNIISIVENSSELIDKGLEYLDENTRFVILPSYTAMMELRSILQKKYNLKDFWE